MEAYDPQFDNIVTGFLADDPLIRFLAADILDGEIDLTAPYTLPTDILEYKETCEEVREEYGVSQAQVEQAIAIAKENIIQARRSITNDY